MTPNAQVHSTSGQPDRGKIIFVLGPSAVGKSTVSRDLQEKERFIHIDMDKKNAFEKNGFPKEWDTDLGKVDLEHFAKSVQNQIYIKQIPRAVYSLPPLLIFRIEQIRMAESLGIHFVRLWGSEELCMKARKERQPSASMRRYQRIYMDIFKQHSQAEFAPYRIEAFKPNGSRKDRQSILDEVLKHIF